MSEPIKLSVAAPAYNEAEGIEAVVTEWHSFLSACDDVSEFEIVICNDGSKDRTGDILDRLTLPFPQLRPLHFAQNQGAAAALNHAIAATHCDWVLLIDSDGQFPIENLPDMLAAVRRTGGKAAIGIRQKKDALRPVRQLGQRAGVQYGAWHRPGGLQLRLQAGVGTDLARAGAGSQRHELFHRSDFAPAGTPHRAGGSGDHAPAAHHRRQQHEAGARRHPSLPVRDLHCPAPAVAAAGYSHAAASMTRIVLFCGGRGSATIIRALLRQAKRCRADLAGQRL